MVFEHVLKQLCGLRHVACPLVRFSQQTDALGVPGLVTACGGGSRQVLEGPLKETLLEEDSAEQELRLRSQRGVGRDLLQRLDCALVSTDPIELPRRVEEAPEAHGHLGRTRGVAGSLEVRASLMERPGVLVGRARPLPVPRPLESLSRQRERPRLFEELCRASPLAGSRVALRRAAKLPRPLEELAGASQRRSGASAGVEEGGSRFGKQPHSLEEP